MSLYHNPSPEERKRLIDDTLKPLATKLGFNAKQTAEQQCMARAVAVSKRIKNLIIEVVRTAKEDGRPYDRRSAGDTLITLFEQGFKDWSHEELLFLVACLQTGVVMESLEDLHNQGII